MAPIKFAELDLDRNGYLTRDEINKAEKSSKVKICTLYVGMTAEDLIKGVTEEKKLAEAQKFYNIKPIEPGDVTVFTMSSDKLLEDYAKELKRTENIKKNNPKTFAFWDKVGKVENVLRKALSFCFD